jgi:hypothetical protein
MSAEPGETAAWTEQDERDVQTFALRGFDAVIGTAQNVRWAREILRLRAENERHEATILDLRVEVASLSAQNERLRAPDRPCNRCALRANELDALRSELAAATRERETPPLVSPHVCDECHDTERLDWMFHQNKHGAILTYVTDRRDVDELMAEDGWPHPVPAAFRTRPEPSDSASHPSPDKP